MIKKLVFVKKILIIGESFAHFKQRSSVAANANPETWIK